MKRFFDFNLGYFLKSFGSSAKLTADEVIRSAALPFEVQFCRGTELVTLPDAAIVGVVIKNVGEFDGDSLIPAATLTKDPADGIFKGALNLESIPLDAALVVDGNPANDVASVVKTLALGYSADGVSEPVSSNDVALTIRNNTYRGTEGSGAATAPALIGLLLNITALTGGDPEDLDALPTVGLATNKVIALVIAGEFQIWQLQAGTDDTGPGIVKGLDYDAGTNARIWIRLL